MTKIISSVGRGGTNRENDVRIIQKLLNDQKMAGAIIPLDVDGKVGSKTYARIEAFQENIIKMVRPDGRVDSNGKTFKRLSINVSQKGIDLLKAIEVLATKPYDDQVGINKAITSWMKGATIGYGHLIAEGDWGKYQNGTTKTGAVTLIKIPGASPLA